MIEPLRQTCRRLLEEHRVDVIVGYGRSLADGPAHPIFVRTPQDVDRLVWDAQCYPNLTAWLTRPEVRAMGRPGVVVKGCDERAIVALQQEAQLDRTAMVVIGVVCAGMDQPKCAACDVAVPRWADVVVGDPAAAHRGAEDPAARDERLEAFLARPAAERWSYWQEEFARCVKCYACRQVCPMCYCTTCIVDKHRPVRLSPSATPMGIFAWQVTRAFHQAGRCVGCDECARVCPAGIDLRLLNRSLARAAERHFGYRAGMDPAAEPPIGAYSLQDQETFIR